MIVESLLKKIEEGREGKNQGYSMGLPKLEGIIDGVTKQTYYVVFSNSGAGKSSFCLYSFIYRPLMEHLNDDNFRIIFFSIEMNADMLFAKLLSTYIFETYHRELSMKDLLSRRKNYRLSDESYEIVQKCIPWLQKVESKLIIYDKSPNANTIYAFVSKDLEKFGKFEVVENHKTYIPNNPNMLYMVVVDHISLVRPQTSHTLKQEIDEVSKYLLTLRNIAGITPVVIQQANREQGGMERRKQGVSNFTINDTKDSGGPVQDSEIVISIYNPHRDRLSSYRGYDITQLGDKFRIISVLKSRYGDSDVEIGTAYYGGINKWVEIPKPDDIYDYSKYQNPQWLISDNTPTVDNKKITFKMTM